MAAATALCAVSIRAATLEGSRDAIRFEIAGSGSASAEIISLKVGDAWMLKQAKEEMDAAAKAAQAEARSKSKTPVKKDATISTSATAKPAQRAKAPTEPAQPPPPRTASLFDMPTASPAPAASTATPVKAEPAEQEDEEEILTEIKEDETDDDGVLDEAAWPTSHHDLTMQLAIQAPFGRFV